jgi:hypothetical protein
MLPVSRKLDHMKGPSCPALPVPWGSDGMGSRVVEEGVVDFEFGHGPRFLILTLPD